MNRRIALLWASLITIFFASNMAIASEGLSQAEAEKLIKGNTVEGLHTKWDTKMIWYFHESGQLRKQNQHGKRGKADWSIDKKGQLCFIDKHMSDEKCEPIIPRADGGYDANDGKWRWDKVVTGNPHNL